MHAVGNLLWERMIAVYSLSEKVESLKRCPLFENMSFDALKMICITSSIIKASDGDVLFDEGDESFDAYVVFEGEAEAFINPPEGEEMVLAKFGPSEVFGEFAMLGQVPRTAGMRITKDFTGLRISKDHFFEIITEYPEVSLKIMHTLVHRLLASRNRFLKMMKKGDEPPF